MLFVWVYVAGGLPSQSAQGTGGETLAYCNHHKDRNSFLKRCKWLEWDKANLFEA